MLYIWIYLHVNITYLIIYTYIYIHIHSHIFIQPTCKNNIKLSFTYDCECKNTKLIIFIF